MRLIDMIDQTGETNKTPGKKSKANSPDIDYLTDNTDQYLNEKQVCRMMGVSLSSLRKHRGAGTGLPYSKLGSSVRYSKREIVEYMDKRRVVPAVEAAKKCQS